MPLQLAVSTASTFEDIGKLIVAASTSTHSWLASLRYDGRIGELANEHLFSIAVANEDLEVMDRGQREQVDQVVDWLRQCEGVQRVEIMTKRLRSKRDL